MADNVFKIEFNATLYGQIVQHGLHMYVDGSPQPSVSEWQAVADALDTGWYNGGAFGYGQGEDLFVTDYLLRNIRIRQVKGGNIDVTRYVTGQAGTQPADGVTAVVAACVSLRTGLVGRSRRGRTYWPGVSGANIGDDGLIDPALQAYYEAAHTDIESVVNAALPAIFGVEEVVFSRLLNDGFIVMSRECDPYVATQRRRAIPARGVV